jgi:hypothetical protein
MVGDSGKVDKKALRKDIAQKLEREMAGQGPHGKEK